MHDIFENDFTNKHLMIKENMTLIFTNPCLAALMSHSGIGCLKHDKHSTGPVKQRLNVKLDY